MSRTKSFWLTAALGLVLGAGVWAGVSLREGGTSGVPGVVTRTAPPASARALTLLEAWDAAAREWQAWPGRWRVTAVASTDVGDDPAADAGRDGRRRGWQVELSGEGGQRWLRLLDGAVVMVVDPLAGAPAPTGGPAALDRPALDSPAAIDLALRLRPAFAPGGDKARGFHFTLWRPPEGTAARLDVLGAAGGWPARVGVDPASGSFIEAKRQGAAGGTVASSADGQSWTTAPLALEAERVLLAQVDDGAFLVATATDGDLVVQRWAGEAAGWATVARQPGAETRRILFAVAVWAPPGGAAPEIVIASDGGLWSYLPASGSFVRWGETAPVQRLLVDAAGALHAQVVTGPGVSVHAVAGTSRSLERQPGPDIGRLAVPDGAVVGLASEGDVSEATGVFLWQAELSAGGAPYSLAGTFRAVLRRAAGGAWKPVLAEQAVGLAAADDGQRLVLATVAGVFASADAGASWRGVLPGSRDFTWSVAFSGGAFLAAKGGDRQWQDF